MSTENPLSIPLADIPEGTMRSYVIDGREIVVCRTKHGVHALDNICTHAFARLNEGRLRGTRLICPLHGASFDIRDGRALGAPASEPLAVFPARITGDSIEIEIRPAAAHPFESR
jgi:3-phenylpropionate/trans-cinnamate dioxygenase ferredoxin subunit